VQKMMMKWTRWWSQGMVVLVAVSLLCSVQAEVKTVRTPAAAQAEVQAKRNPRPAVSLRDLPLIQCDVCLSLSAALAQAVNAFAAQKDPLRMLEYEVIEIMENVCKPMNATGHWIREIDVVAVDIPETGAGDQYLSFTRPGGLTKCNGECLTIAKSCEMLLDEVDADDVSVYLYKQAPVVQVGPLQDKLCRHWTRRCAAKNVHKPFSSKQYKRPEIHFVPMQEKDVQMEELVAKMNQMGMRGSLKDRAEMDEMLEKYSDTEDPYGDEDDEF
jgi:hypothetical protein